MAEGVLLMSGEERDRVCVVRRAVEGHLGQREASERLGISVRQFRRLVRAWRLDGDAGLISGHRGRPSNGRMSGEKRDRIADLLQDRRYKGFGATLMAETLLEREGIKVSVETLR